MEERNCNNCNNYRPSGVYQNTEQSDRKMMIPVIITILLCVIAYLGWQNYDLKQKYQNCISVDSDGNMWFTKGDSSELITPSNIWDELDKLGVDDIENYEEITEGLSCRVITYGLENKDADFTAENITYNDLGCGTFDAVVQGETKGHFHLSVVGRHNISNTLACLALASLYGINDGTVQKALTTFHGADRRFEYKGEKNGFTIIDDYAHHPTEIRATLTAAKNYPHKTLWCAFQPHTYTRTRAFLKDFASALSLADKVILADIYAAREKDPGDISSADLARELEKLGKEVHYLRSFDEIEKFILKNLVNGDLLITMGAGNIVEIGENLLNN